MTDQVRGKDLSPGSIVRTWFKSDGARVIGFRPYRGTLSHLWPSGVRIIEFTSNTPKGTIEMTVGNDDYFEAIKVRPNYGVYR